MKVNELFESQVDEAPKWMGGTGGNMPGTTSANPLAPAANWLKKKTGLGAGGAKMKEANQLTKALYKQWVNVVPTLQQAGKIEAGDTEKYIHYLTMFMSSKLGMKDSEVITKFTETLGMVPNSSTIQKALMQAIQAKQVQKQLGKGVGPKAQEPQPQAQPQAQAPQASAPPKEVIRTVNGSPFKWDGTQWVGAQSGRPASDSIQAKLNAQGQIQ